MPQKSPAGPSASVHASAVAAAATVTQLSTGAAGSTRRIAPSTGALRLVLGTAAGVGRSHGMPADAAGSALGVHVGEGGLVYALSAVTALAGIRPAVQADRLLDLLGCPQLTRVQLRMAAVPAASDPRVGTIGALVTLLRWPRAGADRLVADVAARSSAALRTTAAGGDVDARRTFTLVAALAEIFPSDPAVLAPLLLEPLSLAAGDALLLPVGTPHAVLSGAAARFTPVGGSVGVAGLRRGSAPLDEDRTAVLGAIQTRAATVEGPVPAAPGSVTLVSSPAVSSVSVDPDTGLPQVLGAAGGWSLIASDFVPVTGDADQPATDGVRRRWWSSVRQR